MQMWWRVWWRVVVGVSLGGCWAAVSEGGVCSGLDACDCPRAGNPAIASLADLANLSVRSHSPFARTLSHPALPPISGSPGTAHSPRVFAFPEEAP